MSSITTIKITHEQGFTCKESLVKALMTHGLGEGISIIEVSQKYQLSVSKKVRNGQVQRTEKDLSEHLENIVRKILPTYTRLFAIKDFQSRDFKLVRETNTGGGELLVFEKASSLIEGGEFQRLLVTIRPDNTITIDAENFVGRACLGATGPFEQQIGRVIKREMKPEAKIPIQGKMSLIQKDKIRRKQKKRLRI